MDFKRVGRSFLLNESKKGGVDMTRNKTYQSKEADLILSIEIIKEEILN